MRFALASANLAALITPALAVLLPEGTQAPTGAAAEADRLAGGLLGALLRAGDFRGKAGEAHVLYAPETGFERLIVVGMGKPGKLTLESLRDAAGRAALYARELGLPSLTVLAPDAASLPWREGVAAPDARTLARAIGEGVLLSQYQLHTYRTTELDEVKQLHEAHLAGADLDRAALEAGAGEASAIAEAIATARTWILHPGADLPPARFADEARAEGEALGLKVTVLDRAELERQGFNTLLAVGRGSVHEPRLIRLEYHGGAPGEAPLCVVGKGITFDTGGIQIKPGPGMEKMKYDMAGGAAAIAIILACAKLGIKRNVVTIVAAAENMPSGNAVKPSDVVTSYAGLTIEINDTDAEGRLVLADALAYAVKELKPAMIVDMATLTGTVAAALGRRVMGVMGNDQPLVERFLKTAEHAGERGWQLPIFDEYKELLQSDIADLKNYGGRWGDTVNAATFLSAFVGETPWLHLDIAGVGWSDTERGYRPKGPTGVPVRSVVDLIAGWGQQR